MADQQAQQREETSFSFSQDASFNFLDQNNVSMLNRSMGSVPSPSLAKRSAHHLGSQANGGGETSLTSGLNNAGRDDDYFFDHNDDSKLRFDFDALNDEDPNDTMRSLPGGTLKGMRASSAAGNRGINGRGSVPNKNARSTTEKDKDKKTNMTLKEQEKIIDELKKDNFGLKLKIYFLEERLAQLSPDQTDEVLKENIDLKVKLQTLAQEVKKYKKMMLELTSAMEILKEKRQCDLPHGMSEDQQAEYERAMTNAKEYKQESDHLNLKLAELSSEMNRLRDLLTNQKGILPEKEKEYLVQEKNRAISEADKYRQELIQAKTFIDEQNRTIHLLRDQGMMGASNDVLKTILMERDATMTQKDMMAKDLYELQSALAAQRELNRALQHDRDMAKAEAEQLAKSVLELGQQEMVLNMELNRVEKASVRVNQESVNSSMISKDRLEEDRELIKKLNDDIASYHSQVSAQQTLIQNHENDNVQLMDELEILKAREARLSQMLGIDPDDEEELQLRERMEEEGIRSDMEILAWRADKVEERISQLRDHNAELTIQLREKESEIYQLQGDLEDILEANRETVQATDAKAREIQRLKDVINELKEELQHIRAEYDALVPQLDEANRTLRDEEIAHQEEVARLESELDAREQDYTTLENELDKLAGHIENMEDQLQQKETRLGELEGQLEAKVQLAKQTEQMYEDDMSQLEEQLAVMKEKNSELFVANHSATTEIVHLRDEVKHYAKNVDELEGRYRQELSRRTGLEKSLKEEKEERAKEKEVRGKEQEERAKEREVTEKERGRLLMEKDLADKDRGRLLMERDAMEKERVRLAMEKEAADKERMRLLMERDALKREKEGLEIEKTTLMMEAEEDGRKWEEVVKELEQKIVLTESQISRLTGSIGDRDSNMDYLKQQLNSQNEKTKEIVDQYVEKLDAARKEVEQRIQERDYAREEVDKLKREVVERKTELNQAKENMERWRGENKKMAEQIKEITDVKGHLEEMLLSVTQDMREKTHTIEALTHQTGELEFRLAEKESLVASVEAKYHDQIAERNTLLLTIYQYADSLVGGSQSGESKSSSNRNIPKPNTNFALFHEHIISKLKTLSRLTQTFEKRAKELYDRCQEQFSLLEKQSEMQGSRIDRCNKQIKNFKDNSSLSYTQAAKYRSMLDKKTVELEAARAAKIELETQITALRDKLTDLSGIDVRAKHFHTRAQEMQGKLVESEEVWKSRLRELENRAKDAEERLKRERKGAQDRVTELMENNNTLEKKLEASTRKSDNLTDLVDQYKSSLEAKSEINNLKAENVLSKLNDQLREELEEKTRSLDSERQKMKELETEYSTMLEELKRLQKQLARRDNMITKALERLEVNEIAYRLGYLVGLKNINERKEVMENVLLRQATQDIDATLRMRADSITSSWESDRLPTASLSNDKRLFAAAEEAQSDNVSRTTESPVQSDRSASPSGRSRSPNRKPISNTGLRAKSPAVPGMARQKPAIPISTASRRSLTPKTGTGAATATTTKPKPTATRTTGVPASTVKTRKL